MAKRIVIVSGLQLCDNPRVVKEASTLASRGYDVHVLSSLTSTESLDRNKQLADAASWKVEYLADATSKSLWQRAKWNYFRLRRRFLVAASRLLGRKSIHQATYFASEMLSRCLRLQADLNIVHVEGGLWVGRQLVRAGRPVAVDMEDWYTEDLRNADTDNYPLKLLRECESVVLKHARYVSTTSQVMSFALGHAYQCAPPIVLYNAFPLSERRSHELPPLARGQARERARIGWVSQVIGPDRGLEQLVAATHLLRHPVEIHLTGRLRSGMEQSLRQAMSPASALFLQDQVSHDQLLPLMQTYDLGFAGELADNPNKDLTVSNKILHYLLAGIPVIVSDTKGQLEICDQVPDATRVYSQRDPQSLAEAIDSLLESPETLRQAKEAAWNAGSTMFCWEASEGRLLDAVCGAIGPPDGAAANVYSGGFEVHAIRSN